MLIGAFFGDLRRRQVRTRGRSASLIAAVAGGLLALVHAFFSIHLRADQIVGGTAINFLALGITGYFFIDVYGDQGTPAGIPRIPTCNLDSGSIAGHRHVPRRRRSASST